MRKLILDVAPELHEERARMILGSLNRASGLITLIAVITVAFWVAHAVDLVPLINRQQHIPQHGTP